MAGRDLSGRLPQPPDGFIVPLAIALFVVITLLRLAVSNPVQAVGFLYVIPISLVATERGWRAGIVAAVAAIGLTILWAVVQDVSLGAVGYGSRAATFASVGLLVGYSAEQRRRLEADRELLMRELRATAMSDPLTGLPNRRAWDERFELELGHARRSGRPLTVAAIDLDGLKQVNDALGHEQGDRLIENCARLCATALRADMDFIARVGGDEFLALLPGCEQAEAEEIAQRMLDAAAESEHSFSIGLATWDRAEQGFELVHRADQAMYAAKVRGARIAAALPSA